jgi:hypothetical protein
MPLLQQTPDQITENASNAASSPKDAAIVTTISLTTAAGSTHTLTFSSPAINANSIVTPEVGNGTNSAGTPAIASVTPSGASQGVGSVAIVIQNIHASNAFNGTLKVAIVVFN